MSNSYILPQKRTNTFRSEFASKDDLITSLAIQLPNNVHFADPSFSIRIFSDEITLLPEAERLFKKESNQYILNKTNIGRETLQHYHLKNLFFDSADLSIAYTNESGKLIINFGVEVESEDSTKRIKGCLSYTDLGLITRASVGAFVSKFSEINKINGTNNKIIYIINTLSTIFKSEIENAMRREIIEECTPDGERALHVGPLEFIRTYVEKNNKRLNVRYVFRGCKAWTKVREMDIFPMNYNGEDVNAYYIYGTGIRSKDHKYYIEAPYSEVEEEIIDPQLKESDLIDISSLTMKNNNLVNRSKYISPTDIVITGRTKLSELYDDNIKKIHTNLDPYLNTVLNHDESLPHSNNHILPPNINNNILVSNTVADRPSTDNTYKTSKISVSEINRSNITSKPIGKKAIPNNMIAFNYTPKNITTKRYTNRKYRSTIKHRN